MSKSIFKSKTFWVNVLGIAVQIGFLFSSTYPEAPKYVGFSIGVMNIILRLLTTQPVHFKEVT